MLEVSPYMYRVVKPIIGHLSGKFSSSTLSILARLIQSAPQIRTNGDGPKRLAQAYLRDLARRVIDVVSLQTMRF